MEKETNPLHFLIEHPVILFLIAAVVLVAVIFSVGYLIGRYFEKRRADRESLKQ